MRSSIRTPVFFICLLLNGPVSVSAADFGTFERGHFVIHHSNREWANSVSWKAEYHYKRIVNHFGVPDFRPWEGPEKCHIYLFPAKAEYMSQTGAPEWSGGVARIGEEEIYSFEGAEGFEDNILPHEVTHVLLHKFMGGREIPLWLNEGMAQFEEDSDDITSLRKRAVKSIFRSGGAMPLSELFGCAAIPNDGVDAFYFLSASVIDYLITDNIKVNFGRFLQCVKSGSPVDRALIDSFQWKYKDGAADLEKQWREFVSQRY